MLCANSEATAALLTPSTLLSSVKVALSRKAKAKAPFSVGSEVTMTLLKSRVLLGSARLAASGRSKALSA